MRARLLLLAPLAFGLSVAAQAADLTFTVTGGTFLPTGNFSGSFQINPTTEIVDGGTFFATAPTGVGAINYTFIPPASGMSLPGLATFGDGAGDTFRLALNGSITALKLNTIASNGTGGDTELTTKFGFQFDATGGTVTAAPTPEPSSLILLGTGALGLAGAVRRRFLA